ncbi:MAG: acyl-CoA dehydratase activase-related protein, partial [Burkholderiales bacterium]|nr:acyl-CoA dehydratase activase-related protein [Burkholderiales bacterium]
RLSSGKKFVSGNRCDFGAKAKSGKKEDTGSEQFNLHTWKLRHLFEGTPLPIEKAPRGILGIPRVLNMYEHYPYWFTLFTELGFRIELSPESNKEIFNSGLSSMPSQSVCLPAKLVHGHIAWLSSHGICRIWFPCVPKEKKFFSEQINTFSCPVVTGYPEVAKLNLEASERRKLNILSPFLVIANRKSVFTALHECFPDIPRKEIETAVKKAENALKSWHDRLINEAERILADSQAAGKKVIVLAGRPYHVDPFINHGLPTYLESLGVSVLTEDSIVHLAPDPGNLRVINQWSFHSRLYRAAAFAAQEPNVEMIQLTSFGCGIDAITSDQIEEILCKKEKTYTLLKIDEGSSIGQAKIRIASTLATVEERDAKKKTNSASDGHKEAKPTNEKFKEAPYYKKSYRKTHTILAPQMSPIHFRLIANVFEYNGYHMDLLPAVSEQAIETGLKYVNNDACYPSIVTIGQLIEALRTGEYDPDTTALMLSQTCGPCRATNYISLLRKALDNLGFPQVPVVSVSGGELNKQPGFSITPMGLRRLSLAVLYGDMLQRLYYSTLSHELFKGDAQELLNKWLKRATDVSCWGSTSKFKSDLDVMVREFGSVPQDGNLKPKVGIVGEILLKFHPDANKHLAQMVIEEGGEPILTDFADFFLYCMTDSIWEHRHMNGSFFKSKTNELFMAWVETLRAPMRKALYGTGYFPVSDLNDLQDSVAGIVNLGEQAGEGWLLPAEMIAFARHGINNVLCLQPFGCLPNHITGKGVIKALREKFKDFNLMALDFEAGTSEAYISNRVKLFMTVAHEATSTPNSKSHFLDIYAPNPLMQLDSLGRVKRNVQPVESPVRIYRNKHA